MPAAAAQAVAGQWTVASSWRYGIGGGPPQTHSVVAGGLAVRVLGWDYRSSSVSFPAWLAARGSGRTAVAGERHGLGAGTGTWETQKPSHHTLIPDYLGETDWFLHARSLETPGRSPQRKAEAKAMGKTRIAPA